MLLSVLKSVFSTNFEPYPMLYGGYINSIVEVNHLFVYQCFVKFSITTAHYHVRLFMF